MCRTDHSAHGHGPRPFAVIGMPRTGSTLLLASLGTHPAIAIRDEIFHRLRSERAGNHAIRRAEGSTTFFDPNSNDWQRR